MSPGPHGHGDALGPRGAVWHVADRDRRIHHDQPYLARRQLPGAIADACRSGCSGLRPSVAADDDRALLFGRETVWLQSGPPGQSRSVTARAAQRALPLIMVL